MTIAIRSTEPGYVPSLYFGESYGHLTAVEAGGTWFTVTDPTGGFQVPLITRKIGQWQDGVSPYGYSGVFVSPGLSDSLLRRHWSAFIDMLRSAGIISLFLRFTPWDAVSSDRVANLPFATVRHLSDTILVPIQDLDQTWTQMTGRSRTAIRQARKHGLTAQVVALDASISRPDHAFRYLYDLSMRRLHAGQEYFFSDDYFHRCFEVLGDCTRLAVVKDAEATIVAAALLFVDGERLHYHLSASNLGAAHRGANNLLLWTAAEWGNQKGLKWFHLGGGTRPNDSLFSFKASFGGQRCHYLVGTVIVDSDRYHALTAERAHSLGCEVTDLLATKYFPAYRVPRTMIEGVNVESFYS